jgi:hypothetical protein
MEVDEFVAPAPKRPKLQLVHALSLDQWKKCPHLGNAVMPGKILPIKAPTNMELNDSLPPEHRFDVSMFMDRQALLSHV